MKQSRKHKGLLVFAACVLFLTLVYLAMFLSTNPVIEYVESVFKGEISQEDIPASLDTYNTAKHYPEVTEMDLDITRLFTLHNFRDGYIWIKYDIKTKDADGNPSYSEITTSRWKIHKSEDEWEVTEVKNWWKTDSFWYKLRSKE